MRDSRGKPYVCRCLKTESMAPSLANEHVGRWNRYFQAGDVCRGRVLGLETDPTCGESTCVLGIHSIRFLLFACLWFLFPLQCTRVNWTLNAEGNRAGSDIRSQQTKPTAGWVLGALWLGSSQARRKQPHKGPPPQLLLPQQARVLSRQGNTRYLRESCKSTRPFKGPSAKRSEKQQKSHKRCRMEGTWTPQWLNLRVRS